MQPPLEICRGGNMISESKLVLPLNERNALNNSRVTQLCLFFKADVPCETTFSI